MKDKKLWLWSLVFVVLLGVLVFVLAHNVSAELVNINPQTGEAQVLGINPENIPQTPEDAGAVARDYLKREWQKIIANNKYIGPVHNFLLSHQAPIIFLFNAQYEFSLTFICIFFLWLFIWLVGSDYINSFRVLKLGLPWLFGLGIVLILAHIGVLNLIVAGILNVVYSKDLWWMRLLLWFAFFIVFFLIIYLEQTLKKSNEQGKKESEKEELKQKVKETEAYVKGAKKGQKIKEEVGYDDAGAGI